MLIKKEISITKYYIRSFITFFIISLVLFTLSTFCVSLLMNFLLDYNIASYLKRYIVVIIYMIFIITSTCISIFLTYYFNGKKTISKKSFYKTEYICFWVMLIISYLLNIFNIIQSFSINVFLTLDFILIYGFVIFYLNKILFDKYIVVK